jgi:hypothetical protein
MAINQLSTANTFQQWLIATQSLIEKSNFYEDRTNLVFETANNTSNIANLVFANAAVVNAQTTIVLTTYSDTLNTYNNTVSVYANTLNTYNSTVTVLTDAQNTSNVIVNRANSFANTVNVTAQNAYNTANAALATSQNAANLIYEVFDDTANNVTLYPALFVSNTGTPNTAFVSSTKLYYNPSPGELSATNFDSLSDVNKKTDIETIENAIQTVGELRGVTFRWKDNGHKSMGLIAQEVETVVPEVVVTNELGDKSVTYGSLIGLIVESIKDLNKQVIEIRSIINKE